MTSISVVLLKEGILSWRIEVSRITKWSKVVKSIGDNTTYSSVGNGISKYNICSIEDIDIETSQIIVIITWRFFLIFFPNNPGREKYINIAQIPIPYHIGI